MSDTNSPYFKLNQSLNPGPVNMLKSNEQINKFKSPLIKFDLGGFFNSMKTIMPNENKSFFYLNKKIFFLNWLKIKYSL